MEIKVKNGIDTRNVVSICTWVTLLFLSSITRVGAQGIPAFCNESARARWVSYMDWIKPTAPINNGLSCTYQLYNVSAITLSATGIFSNLNKLIGTGLAQFIKSDRVGNSCLSEKATTFRNFQTCSAEVKRMSAIFGVGGQPNPNPGLIKFNDKFYKYVSSSGDVHSFKREDADEVLVIHIKRTQIF